MYCLDTEAIITIERAGLFDNLHEAVKNKGICYPEGVYRELTDTTTIIGTKIERWEKYGSLHYLSSDELIELKRIETTYGPSFNLKGQAYPGFWRKGKDNRAADAQVVTVSKMCKHIAITNDRCIRGACMLEDIECISTEEFARRLINGPLDQSKMF